MPQTKQFHYAIHSFAFAEPLTTTVWGYMPEANAYKGAIDEWMNALHYKPAEASQPAPLVPAPLTPESAPLAPSPALTPASSAASPLAPPPPPTTPTAAYSKKPTDSFCPKGEKHMYSEPIICGYSWHGPVRAANCINCGYHWTDH